MNFRNLESMLTDSQYGDQWEPKGSDAGSMFQHEFFKVFL